MADDERYEIIEMPYDDLVVLDKKKNKKIYNGEVVRRLNLTTKRVALLQRRCDDLREAIYG